MRTRRRITGAALLGAAALVAAACSSGGSTGNSGGGGPAGLTVPTAKLPVLTHIGKGEGQLNLIAWAGYLDPRWVKPFEKQTGCIVNGKIAGSSDDMVSLMANGGGGQWDMVSSSGDADLRLIYAGDTHPVNMNLIPAWKEFFPQFRSPAFNTVGGVHYGVSLQWGPNVLMYNKRVFKTPPTSWSVIYSPKYRGKITVYDYPIQIADAALYLMVHQPSLGITDPYELTQPQFQATVKLMQQQRPLLKAYWASNTQENSMFSNGDAVVGEGWPLQVTQLTAAHFPIGQVIPSEGATGWADTWMLAAKAPHPNCAYMWMRYISEPQVQAMQAVYWGETPDNMLACQYMNKLQPGSCALYHANAPASFMKAIWFWKTPITTCDNGKPNCVPYSEWTTAWNTLIK